MAQLHLQTHTSFAPRPSPSDRADAPIALFDSGVGGLTVMTALSAIAPSESILYVADQAHVPYGGRPLEEVRSFARGLTAYAFAEGAKLVLMACNVSSATYGDEGAATYGADRVLGVVEPGALAAVEASRTGRIGVLATQGTVASEAYPISVERRAPAARVSQVACPAFVPLVEAQQLSGPATETAIREALEPLRSAGVDTVVLGCTHYPFLLATLRQIAPDLVFVDPARAAVLEALRRLGARRSPRHGVGRRRLLTTGDPARFEAQARAFLGEDPAGVHAEAIVWTPERPRASPPSTDQLIAQASGSSTR